jgi:hypothetical protein
MSRFDLHIYDDRSDVDTQPLGPRPLDLPEDATDDQIVEEIKRYARYADPSRPFEIEHWDGPFNNGWQLVYLDGPSDDTRRFATTLGKANRLIARARADRARAEE